KLSEDYAANCFWAPDGRRVACSGESGAGVIDLTRPFGERVPRPLSSQEHGTLFIPSSWTRDGSRLAGGLVLPGKARIPGVVTYSFASGSYERLTGQGDNAVWLPDGRRLLYQVARRILLLDTRTRKTSEVLDSPAESRIDRLSLSPDGRVLTVVRILEEGDVWMLERTD
ncbi:MAG: hypothetical protein ACJ76J_15425, partial [Thermoanaerobaculia bacterium]